MKRLLVGGIIGLLAGTILGLAGFISGGGGHGCYVPMGVFAGPLALFAWDGATVFVIPVLWAVYGAMIGLWAGSGKAAERGRWLLLAHNVCALVAVQPWYSEGFSDWAYFGRDPGHAVILALYAAAISALWWKLPWLDVKR